MECDRIPKLLLQIQSSQAAHRVRLMAFPEIRNTQTQNWKSITNERGSPAGPKEAPISRIQWPRQRYAL